MGRPRKYDPDKITTSTLEPKIDSTTNKMDVGGLLIPVTNTLTALLYGFANHTSPRAREFYFWRIADLLWNRDDLPEHMFLKHPWAEKIIHECINNKYVAVGGAASCVAGDTRMFDPISGKHPTIQSLCESNTRPWVMTLNGPVLADVPYLKGRKELFEFRLSNGAVFRCTEDHRLLTPSGWIHAKQTSVGSELYGYAPCLQGSTSGSGLSDLPQDALRCCHTAEDFQSDCRPFFHLCGAQLREAKENALETLPLQACAPAHSECACEHTGVPSDESAHTHPCPQCDLSKRSETPPFSKLETLWSPRCGEERPPHFFLESQYDDQSLQESDPHHTDASPIRNFFRKLKMGSYDLFAALRSRAYSRVSQQLKRGAQADQQQGEYCQAPDTVSQFYPNVLCGEEYDHQSSCRLTVSRVVVESIRNVGEHDFYDLNVPVEHHYFAEGGIHHNSGKSHTLAGYGIISWLARPRDTLVLMTSTTLREARKRIWGSVISLLSVIEGAPINIRDSIGSANYVDENGQTFDRAGLSLIAAEKSRTREAIGKFIGLKQKNVLLIGDELGELSEAIQQAALANLSKNPRFEFVGLSNPASRFDAFGVWSTPKDGWESITPEADDEWTTKWGGKYIRLDGERSPNVLAGQTLYPFLPTAEKIEEDKALLGEKSRAYYRMVRAVFFDSDEAEGIYGEAEILKAGAMNKVQFVGKSTLIAGVDPAFTNGGDKTIMYTARVGYDQTGQYVLQYEECIQLNDDSTNKSIPRTYQIVNQIKRECEKRKIDPQDVAVDATGAGSPFCDVLAGEWSDAFLRVQFGGKASDRRVSMNSQLTGEELYMNRVSELWFVGKEFMRTRQMFGLTAELAKEFCIRRYEMIKSGTLRVKVESKSELRGRIGSSPDMADAAFVALDLARQRHGLVAVDPPKQSEVGLFGARRSMTMKDLDVVGRSRHAHLTD